ncbi:MAG TPA: carboxypeptidase-like regulatory domain-containing protein [Parafilimonas sp.]
MQKQTSIYIPKPCHEDWNKMTPTQQGKFCSACNKQVVDFSLMSDNQILNFLSHQSGKLCGRFDAEQLQRPLIETKIKKKKSWWMALAMPLLFLFDKSEAQNNVYVNTDSVVNANATKNSLKLDPLDLEYFPSKQITIKGKVIDENNNPVPFATITEKGTHNAVAADAKGNYSIIIKANRSDIILNGSAVSFISTDKKIDAKSDSATIIMKKDTRDLGGVVVITMGYTITRKPVKTIDTLHATAKKLFGTEMFKLYPNPVVNNSIINLEIKNTGNYQMQLLSNQSQLMQTEEINVDTKNATTQIQLQSNIAAGMYYLRLINEQTKKQYTEKFIIQ